MNDSKLPSKQFLIPICSHPEAPFLSELSSSLKMRGCSTEFIPQNEYIGESAVEHLPKESVHLDFIDHTPKKDLDTLCLKYDIDSIRRLVFPQMVYQRDYPPSSKFCQFGSPVRKNFTQYRNEFHRALDYCDALYNTRDRFVPIQFQGGEILRRVLQIVADYNKCPSVQVSFSPVPDAMTLRAGEMKHSESFGDVKYEKLTDAEIERARQLRDSVICKQTLMETSNSRAEPLRDSLRRKSLRIRQYGFDSIPLVADWLRRKGAKSLLASLTKLLYLDADESREFIDSTKYVFYPIQYFRESRVTMRAPAYYDQVWLIEYLSRSLPPGYEIAVKDHPHQLGALPLSSVRAIRRYATTLAPEMSAREVVRRADAVVTLNNTVGYEAVMHGKPVIVLGDAFYSGSEFTQKVRELSQLPKALRRAVKSNGLDEREVLEFAHEIQSTSYDGVWGETNNENVEDLTESVLEFLLDNRS